MLTRMPGMDGFRQVPGFLSVAFEGVGWYPMDINLKFVALETLTLYLSVCVLFT